MKEGQCHMTFYLPKTHSIHAIMLLETHLQEDVPCRCQIEPLKTSWDNDFYEARGKLDRLLIIWKNDLFDVL